MKIFGYEITRKPFFDNRVFGPRFLLFGMIACIVQAATYTHFFASYCYGNAILPKEEQLIKSGPYLMKVHLIRAHYDVEFIPSIGGESYVVGDTDFPRRVFMREVSEQNANDPVAYLWTYTENPVLKVWRVDVGHETVLTYDEALKSYKSKFETSIFMLRLSGIIFFFLIWSLISIKRSN